MPRPKKVEHVVIMMLGGRYRKSAERKPVNIDCFVECWLCAKLLAFYIILPQEVSILFLFC